MQRTTPLALTSFAGLTLKVEVVEGPNQGKEAVAETEGLTIGTADGKVLPLSDESISRFHVELRR